MPSDSFLLPIQKWTYGVLRSLFQSHMLFGNFAYAQQQLSLSSSILRQKLRFDENAIKNCKPEHDNILLSRNNIAVAFLYEVETRSAMA